MANEAFEAMARRILRTALNEGKAAVLLNALYDGGSATVDIKTGKLVIATREMLDQMAGNARARVARDTDREADA